jgi:hypothetical protein
MRNFVLVTATASDRVGKTTTGSGIKKLKRGVALEQFATAYLETVFDTKTPWEFLERDKSWVAIRTLPDMVYTWTFTQYSEDDLFSAVAHLTKEELLRDLKELLPLKASR